MKDLLLAININKNFYFSLLNYTFMKMNIKNQKHFPWLYKKKRKKKYNDKLKTTHSL